MLTLPHSIQKKKGVNNTNKTVHSYYAIHMTGCGVEGSCLSSQHQPFNFSMRAYGCVIFFLWVMKLLKSRKQMYLEAFRR